MKLRAFSQELACWIVALATKISECFIEVNLSLISTLALKVNLSLINIVTFLSTASHVHLFSVK